jgi:uncharacterized protein
MLVKIEEIQTNKPLELTEALAPAVFAELGQEAHGFRFVSATPLKVVFRKVTARVWLKGEFEAQMIGPCKRCLKDVEVKVPVSFELRMVSQAEYEAEMGRAAGEDEGDGEQAGSFMLDEVDAEPFDGKTIALDPIVREQVLLALPVAVLCGNDCKGLCMVCGQDLNEKECGCERKVVDARLAKLKDIKLN